MICADFDNILVPGDNGKQNLDESHTKNIKNMLLAIKVYISALIINLQFY